MRIAILLLVSGVRLGAQLSFAEPGARTLLNAKELGRELRVPAGKEELVAAHFPSFFDYQDLMLYHPRLGYYGSGFVSFTADWSTYPNVLAPYFGHMIAAQAFRMWAGMREAGTLQAAETFTLAEFGAGNGALAESILDYINRQSKANPDARWRAFAQQAVYACYDRSPALSRLQRERNARFGKQFDARTADATNLPATISPASLKGLLFSNEMLDNFSVHKVVLSTDGAAEVAFVVPFLTADSWSELRKPLHSVIRDFIEEQHAEIRSAFPGNDGSGSIYLSRGSYVALLESLVVLPQYSSKLGLLQFGEVYIPATLVPEVATHLRRHARAYAHELAMGSKGVVAYINPGEAKFIDGAGRALRAGYVMTIDYGASWDGLITFGPYGKLRSYGPASSVEKPNPYHLPGLNDITTDVNFGHVVAAGIAAGLKPVYFGYQRALQSGSPVSLETLPPDRPLTERQRADFLSWRLSFQTLRSFKLLVQQKEGTDARYLYPNRDQLPLDVDERELTAEQRARAAVIVQRLSESKQGL